MKGVSQRVKQASVKPFEDQGLPVQFLRNPAADKEEIARAIAAERKVESGLVCALGSMELSPSFEHRGTHGEAAETLPGHQDQPGLGATQE